MCKKKNDSVLLIEFYANFIVSLLEFYAVFYIYFKSFVYLYKSPPIDGQCKLTSAIKVVVLCIG